MKLPFSYDVTKQSSERFCKNLTFSSTQLHTDVTNIYLYIGYNYILVHSQKLTVVSRYTQKWNKHARSYSMHTFPNLFIRIGYGSIAEQILILITPIDIKTLRC